MKNILIAALLALGVINAGAQQNTALKTLIQQSFSYYPKLKELEKANEMAGIRTTIAESYYLPSVVGNASYNYIDPVGKASFPVGPGETRSIQFQPNNNYNAALTLNQVIFDFGRTRAQVEKAKADMQLNRYNTDAAQLQLAAQVANIYYGLIYLRQSAQVQDSVIAFYTQNRKMVEGKVRQGDALQIDLSNIDNSIEQEKSRKVEFERLYARQLALLTYTTGVSEAPSSNSFDFGVVTPSGNDTNENPELQAADRRIAMATADFKAAQRNQLPSLNFTANAGFRNGYQPDIDEIRFNYLAGVTLNVPVFQGRRLRQQVLLSHRAEEASVFAKDNLEASIKRDMNIVQADVQAYEQQIQFADTQIKTANESLRLNRVRYAQGVSTYLDLVFASTNLQRAMLNRLQYEYQRCLSYIEQARLQGHKFWE
jgi:outer membrane protein